MISIQTNTDSLIAQQNLNLDNEFQSNTIQQLTSGYRINKSGDDAAGLAVANGIQSQISQLTQGINNANNGVSQLQIVDGGLSNISTILNRLQTLATESASSTFTGNRSTLNQEYSGLLTEITRQASNINLAAGGTFNNNLSVFVGGGSDAANSTVSVDLSGAQNAVDATSLGLSGTNVLGGGAGFAGNTQRLDAPGATFLSGSANASESFTFHLSTGTGAKTVVATVNGGTNGITASNVLSQLNGTLNAYGISAGLDGNGLLQFSGATAFNVTDGGPAGTGVNTASGLVTGTYVAAGSNTSFTGILSADTDILGITVNGVTHTLTLNATNAGSLNTALSTIQAAGAGNGFTAVLNATNNGINIEAVGGHSLAVTSTEATAGDGITTASGSETVTAPTVAAQNTSNYIVNGASPFTAPAALNTEVVTIQTAGQSIKVDLNATNAGDATAALATINAATSAYGVNAILNSAGTGIDFQSASSFSVNDGSYTTATLNNANPTSVTVPGIFASAASTYLSSTPPSAGAGSTTNANSAILAINSAIAQLGLVQGIVGAGENTLNYAINLAQSQITNFSAAESSIKDADVATQAANLSKSQVLTQTAVAALAQANSEPQAVLKLLQG